MNRFKIILKDPGIIPKRLLFKSEFFLWKKRLYSSKNCLELDRLKGLHQGKRIFLVGNGPSLATADLDRLHACGEITFASNKIYLIYPKTSWRPTYYCAQDTPFGKKFRDQIWQQEPETRLLLPNIFHEQKLATTNSLRFILNMQDKFPHLPEFGVTPAKFFYGGTVTFTMMQWAYYMGFTEIILLGVDADYQSEIQHENMHRLIVTDNVKSHFVDDYYASGEQHHAFNIDKQIRGYESAKKFFARTDVSIFNATRGGNLELFERMDFDSLFPRGYVRKD